MDCRMIEFSPEKSHGRIDKASRILGARVVNRIVAFVLYLLGAKLKTVAELVGMPVDSLKTVIAIVSRDGVPAFRDRRRSDAQRTPEVLIAVNPQVTVRRMEKWCIVDLGVGMSPMRLPISDHIQSRTVLLSMLNAGWLTTHETALALDITTPYCHDLAEKLRNEGAVMSIVDKRQGQAVDYRFGTAEKAELILQYAARAVSGLSTSSNKLTEAVCAHCKVHVSPRTVRLHINKLGLSKLDKSLLELVNTLKKNC